MTPCQGISATESVSIEGMTKWGLWTKTVFLPTLAIPNGGWYPEELDSIYSDFEAH